MVTLLIILLLIRGNIRGRWERGGWYPKSWSSFVVPTVVLLCQIVITYNICFFYFADTISIVMNAFMYSLKFDNSPHGEISASATQRFVLHTGSHMTACLGGANKREQAL